MSTKNGSANGALRQRDEVRVAIVGVGNCASSFVQGVEYYKDADPDDFVPGLMHVDLGGYHVGDIKFTAAFDIDADKVGKDLSEAIWSGQNNTIKFADVPDARREGRARHDARRPRQVPQGEDQEGARARPPTSSSILRETQTDVVVSYLPVGAEEATKWYVEQALAAGCGFVNCIPVFIAREPYWQKRFKKAGLPIIGDDIKSQVGATIVHRTLARLFRERGVRLERTSQLNVGGNMDFYNMLERERLESKKISKTNAVTSMLDYELPEGRRLHRPLRLRAVAHGPQVGAHPDRGRVVRRRAAEHGAEARGLGLAELGRHRDRRGAAVQARARTRASADRWSGPSSYLMKSPPKQVPDPVAHDLTEEFIAQARAQQGDGQSGARRRRRSRASRPTVRGRSRAAADP